MISFSANVKWELCRTAPGAKCCALAEMLGALLYANHFSASCIRIVTENPEFAARLPRLLQRGFGLRFDALPEPEAQGKRVLVLEDPEKISHVFTLCGFSAESSLALHVNLALLENDCCLPRLPARSLSGGRLRHRPCQALSSGILHLAPARMRPRRARCCWRWA